MSDLISRADAIDAVMKYKMPFSIQQEVAREIDALPLADAVSRKDTVTLNSPISIQTEMVAVVRCKDCRHAGECHKSVQYTRNEPNTVTIGYTKIDFCSHGERREP